MQQSLFPNEPSTKKRYSLQERAALVIDRCNDINLNNQVNKFKPESGVFTTNLKEMLAETRRKFDAGQLPWQQKNQTNNNLFINAA